LDIPERYVWLCLRVGRHVDEFVETFFGPAGWERSVADEEPVNPRLLADEAGLLLDSLDTADLEDDRRRWLRGQLESLGCIAARLSGEDIAWADEVELCLGVRPVRTDTTALRDIHRRLDQALPGRGTVRERYNGWEQRNAIPRETLVPALNRLGEILGPRAHALARMPVEESVVYELVSNVPWGAFSRYQGRYRSLVEVNADLPVSVMLLVELAAHEAYPGHHTERAAKEAALYRDLGRVETSVAIAPAPEAVITEGLAMNALEVALGPEPFDVVAEVLAAIGHRFDPIEASEVHRADSDLFAGVTNAAFMLHVDGASIEETEEYLREWCLDSDEKAARDIAFLTDPSSRTYISAYQDGRRLCRGFMERAPGNFTRLLTEQLTIDDLL
jgi:hypothetical protein